MHCSLACLPHGTYFLAWINEWFLCFVCAMLANVTRWTFYGFVQIIFTADFEPFFFDFPMEWQGCLSSNRFHLQFVPAVFGFVMVNCSLVGQKCMCLKFGCFLLFLSFVALCFLSRATDLSWQNGPNAFCHIWFAVESRENGNFFRPRLCCSIASKLPMGNLSWFPIETKQIKGTIKKRIESQNPCV